MSELDNYLTKTNAIGVICADAGCSRPQAEKALRELQDAGRIKVIKTTFSRAFLISRADVDVVIAYIRQGAQAS